MRIPLTKLRNLKNILNYIAVEVNVGNEQKNAKKMERNRGMKKNLHLFAAAFATLLALMLQPPAAGQESIKLSTFGTDVEKFGYWDFSKDSGTLSGSVNPGDLLYPSSPTGWDLSTLGSPNDFVFHLTGFVTTSPGGGFQLTLEDTDGNGSATDVDFSLFGPSLSTVQIAINTYSSPGSIDWANISNWNLVSSVGGSIDATFTKLSVSAATPARLPVITSDLTASGTVGKFFSYTIQAGSSPESFNATDLPPGLTFSGDRISGIPQAPGVFTTSISATNKKGSAEENLRLEFTHEAFEIEVSGEIVPVQRFGAGPKAVIFFGYTPFEMEESLKGKYGADFGELIGDEYSLFLWTYPEEAEPYSQVEDWLTQFLDWLFNDEMTDYVFPHEMNFTGEASSVVDQILEATELEYSDVTLVGNSFGAGLLLWDFEKLTDAKQELDPRFILISPSELFMPPTLPDLLPRTILIADVERDGYVISDPVAEYVAANFTGPLPTDYDPELEDTNPHLIVGEEPVTMSYVFGLLDLLHLAPAITSLGTASGQVGLDFSYSATASGSPSLRTTFAAKGGPLPAGLTINTATGRITGKPAKAGVFNVMLEATNALGRASKSLILDIKAAPRPSITVSPSTLSGFTARRGQASKPRSLSISGSNLTTQVTVRAPTGYQVSRSASTGYASSLRLLPGNSGVLARTTIHVRIAADKKAKVGNRNGNVTITAATGAVSRSVGLKGEVTR